MSNTKALTGLPFNKLPNGELIEMYELEADLAYQLLSELYNQKVRFVFKKVDADGNIFYQCNLQDFDDYGIIYKNTLPSSEEHRSLSRYYWVTYNMALVDELIAVISKV